MPSRNRSTRSCSACRIPWPAPCARPRSPRPAPRPKSSCRSERPWRARWPSPPSEPDPKRAEGDSPVSGGDVAVRRQSPVGPARGERASFRVHGERSETMNRFEIIKRPLDTEKLDRMRDRENKFAFEIDMKANKTEVKQAIEQLFKVKVVDVKTAIVRGKFRRIGRNEGKRPNWKKAIVTLKEGDAISLFEGK